MKKILIVEDDRQLLKLYTSQFTRLGYEVDSAFTAVDGLAKAKAEPHPNLILLDIMLPGGANGFDVLEDLKRSNLLDVIPVIMLTNLDGEEETAKSIGAKDYIVKANTSLADVAAKVQRCMGDIR